MDSLLMLQHSYIVIISNRISIIFIELNNFIVSYKMRKRFTLSCSQIFNNFSAINRIKTKMREQNNHQSNRMSYIEMVKSHFDAHRELVCVCV